jgi:hypothetical protein
MGDPPRAREMHSVGRREVLLRPASVQVSAGRLEVMRRCSTTVRGSPVGCPPVAELLSLAAAAQTNSFEGVSKMTKPGRRE